MKRIIIIATCLAAAGAAFADDITIEATPFVSTRTRAEVIAEMQAARAAPNPWADSYDQLADFRSTLTREEVVADFLLTRDEVQAFNGEDSGSSYLMAARNLGAVAPVLAQAGK